MTPPQQATPQHVLLHTLPHGHPLRRAALLGAQCRNVHSSLWRDVGPTWGIAGASYDQLTAAWTSATEFRVTAPA